LVFVTSDFQNKMTPQLKNDMSPNGKTPPSSVNGRASATSFSQRARTKRGWPVPNPPSPLRRILDNLGEALAIVEACATGERSDEPSGLVQRSGPFRRQRSICLGEPPQHPNCPERPAVVRSLGENLEVLAEIFHWQTLR